jgi:uncharacterized membrane protein (DUF106 family)
MLSLMIMATFSDFLAHSPRLIVIVLSIVIGLLMVLVFAALSDQKAIHVAKDQLKAHMLAVRLYQDQLPVVVRSYGKILRGTGRYIQLAFRPLLFVIIPITLMIAQVDRWLGYMPVAPSNSFLLQVQTASDKSLDGVGLQLPEGMMLSAPAVHVTAEKQVVWRVQAQQPGKYDVNVTAGDQTFSKQVTVSPALSRVSPVRLRGKFWERIFSSGESALPDNSPIESIAVAYAPRDLRLFGIDWNWIVLFFIASLAFGFLFKTVLGIEV